MEENKLLKQNFDNIKKKYNAQQEVIDKLFENLTKQVTFNNETIKKEIESFKVDANNILMAKKTKSAAKKPRFQLFYPKLTHF